MDLAASNSQQRSGGRERGVFFRSESGFSGFANQPASKRSFLLFLCLSWCIIRFFFFISSTSSPSLRPSYVVRSCCCRCCCREGTVIALLTRWMLLLLLLLSLCLDEECVYVVSSRSLARGIILAPYSACSLPEEEETIRLRYQRKKREKRRDVEKKRRWSQRRSRELFFPFLPFRPTQNIGPFLRSFYVLLLRA